jgi:hypothetical protein
MNINAQISNQLDILNFNKHILAKAHTHIQYSLIDAIKQQQQLEL